MQITLSPVFGFGAPETELSVSGDVLTVDGVAYDLGPVPEGGEASPQGEHPFLGVITRQGGVVHATVRVTLGSDAAPDQPTSAQDWRVPVEDGPVAMPVARIQQGDVE